MGGPCDEGAVGPEPAVGDEEMEVRMPVGTRAGRLETRDDADRQVALPGERADGRRDRAGGDACDLAERAATIQAIRAEPLRDGADDLPVRPGREERRVQPLVQMARRFA